MADRPPAPETPVSPGTAAVPPKLTPVAAASQGNPAFRALGLPKWMFKLPSRNWMIFFSVVGGWTGALVYDRRQKKKAQEKWCTLVSHVAHEPLATNTLPRKVTVYLAAPPGDSIRSTREHFVEYVKPVLVAAALDWDVVEGRREGDVRAGTAERIRKSRRKHGEVAETPVEEDVAFALERLRGQIGVQELPGQKGDIIIGRHTWKEYVRGVHEGWLGPIDPPVPVATTTKQDGDSLPTSDLNLLSPPQPISPTDTPSDPASSTTATPSTSTTTMSPPSDLSTTNSSNPPPAPSTHTPATKPPVPAAHNTPQTYAASPLSPSLPTILPASAPIAFPHILGFFNTPIRVYRFLTRRYTADDVGRQTAAVVLAAHRRYHHSGDLESSPSEYASSSGGHTSFGDATTAAAAGVADAESSSGSDAWEQQRLLVHEEKGWYKGAKKRTEGEGERVWLDDMVIDPRIGSRMRRFELEAAEEDRARRIGQGSAGIPGRPGRKVGAEEEEGEEV